MELHLALDPQEVEYLENQGITEELSDKLTQVVPTMEFKEFKELTDSVVTSHDMTLRVSTRSA